MFKHLMGFHKQVFLTVLIFLAFLFVTYVILANCIFFDSKMCASADESNDNLIYTLYNDNKEYSVSASNRDISEVRILDTYNGLPVTEVADNAFVNCSNLLKVFIPYSVKRIGNNAFANCRKLERIIGMTKVETIGNNAFAVCLSLDNLILPTSIKNLGNTILRNNPNRVYCRLAEYQMQNINTNWNMGRADNAKTIYGNDLVYEEVYNDDETIIGYNIIECQNLESYETDYVVNCSYNNLPVINIKQGAFYYNSFSTLTIKHNCENIEQSENHCLNVENSAFFGVAAESIDIQVDITLNDNENVQTEGFDEREKYKSTDVFTYSTIKQVNLPDSFDTIPRSMFSGCECLKIIKFENNEYNHIAEGIEVIGARAFEGCKNLEEIYIPHSVKYIGNAVFLQWGKNPSIHQTLHIAFYVPDSNWDKNWLGETNIDFTVEYLPIKVVFDKQGGTGGTDGVTTTFDSTMPSATAPTRLGYTFNGYWSGKNGTGTKYYNADMSSAHNWDIAGDTTLYAAWIPNKYTVTLDKQGGTGGTDKVTATFDSAMPSATAPTRTGYTFDGYYLIKDNITVKYYNADMSSAHDWDIASDTTIYAQWIPNKYSVTLDKQGGTGGTDGVTATFDSTMPSATAPTRTGYTFDGYRSGKNGTGTKYYNADMSSAHDWDIASDTTIYAQWIPNKYTVTLDKQGGIGGTDKVTTTFDSAMPSATAPARIGYTFNGYWSGKNGTGTKYYNADMSSAHNWDIAGDTTLYAAWIPNKYTVTLDKQGGTGGTDKVTATFDSAMPSATAPAKKGYIFNGYVDADGSGYYNEKMRSVKNWDKDENNVMLYAQWIPISITIKFEVNTEYLVSLGTTELKVHYDDFWPIITMPILETGYFVEGYYYKNYTNYYYYEDGTPAYSKVDLLEDVTFVAYVKARDCYVFADGIHVVNGETIAIDNFKTKYDEQKTITAPDSMTDGSDTRLFTEWIINLNGPYYYDENSNPWISYSTDKTISFTVKEVVEKYFPNYTWSDNIYFRARYGSSTQGNCIAEGTLITLSDGKQIPVEKLTGEESLLVWDFVSGKFGTAPILFIDSDPLDEYSIINLFFSDGTTVKVISEHGFWDFNLNRYVYLDEQATEFIGHWFNKQITDDNSNLSWTKVQLINVEIRKETTTVWSPVTYGHLCYYVNGMLSMPGGISGLFNIFEVNPETLKYDETEMIEDLKQYGVFTYEEFYEMVPIPEEIFNAFSGQFLKVSIGKGLIDMETIKCLVERYQQFF